MSWTDKDIDQLAKKAAARSTFEYKSEYFADIEAALPVAKRKDFLWFFTAFVFVGAMIFSIGKSINTQRYSDMNSKGVSVNVSDRDNKKVDFKSNTAFNDNSSKSMNKDSNRSNENSYNDIKNKSELDNINEPKTATISKKYSNQNSYQEQASVDPKIEQNIRTEDQASLLSNNTINNVSASQRTQNKTSENESTDEQLLDVGLLRVKPLVQTNKSIGLEALSVHFSKSKMPFSSYMYVQALGGGSQSLISPSSKLSSSFGLGVGFHLQKGKWSFNTGVNGVWSSHKDLNLTREAKVYGFGADEYRFEFLYKEIYSMELELSVGYKLNRHAVNLGVRPSFVVGSKVGIVEEINTKGIDNRVEYGFMDGLNRFGIKPTVGYSFDITSSLKVGLNIGVQMMPMVNEDFLEGENNKLPLDGQLYLRKALRFKK